jgi:hypothetical protein
MKILKKLFRFNLYLFGDEGAEGEGAEGDNSNPEGTTGEGAEGAQPFASFPDEKSFMTRVGREARKQMTTMLTNLGIKDEAELKTFMASKKASTEADRTELEKAIALQTDLMAERDNAVKGANNTLKKAEVKIASQEAGIKAERMPIVMKLIDMEEIEVVDGVVDAVGLKEQISKLLIAMPELVQAGNNLPNKGGASFGGAGEAKPLSLELIKTMTKEQVASRLPEIQAFMSANPQKKKPK